MTTQQRLFDDSLYDENGLIKDGATIRVPMFVMDSVQQAIALSVGDARVEAYAQRDAFMRDAWRNPSARPAQPVQVARPALVPPTTSARTTNDARDAALATREARLRDAWKSPTRNVA